MEALGSDVGGFHQIQCASIVQVNYNERVIRMSIGAKYFLIGFGSFQAVLLESAAQVPQVT